MKARDLLRHVAGVGAITVLDRLGALLMGMLLVRWLGEEGYGVYTVVMVAVSVGLVLTRFGLPEVIVREVAAGQADPARLMSGQMQRRLICLANMIALGLSALAALVALLILPIGAWRAAVFMGLLVLPLTSLMETLSSALRGWQRAATAQALSLLLPTLAMTAMLAVMFFSAPHLAAPDLALALRAAVVALATVLCWWMLARVSGPVAHGAPHPSLAVPSLLRQAAPFILLHGIAIILSRTDILMLGALSAVRDAGIYNLAMQAALLVMLVVSVADTVVVPEFARLYAAGNLKALEKFAITSARLVVAAGLPVALGLILFGAPLLRLLFGDVAGEGAFALSILVGGFAVSLVFGSAGFLLNMTGHQRHSVRVMGLAALANLVLNAALIPLMGMEGAALATALTLIAQKASLWHIVRRELGIDCGCLALR